MLFGLPLELGNAPWGGPAARQAQVRAIEASRPRSAVADLSLDPLPSCCCFCLIAAYMASTVGRRPWLVGGTRTPPPPAARPAPLTPARPAFRCALTDAKDDVAAPPARVPPRNMVPLLLANGGGGGESAGPDAPPPPKAAGAAGVHVVPWGHSDRPLPLPPLLFAWEPRCGGAGAVTYPWGRARLEGRGTSCCCCACRSFAALTTPKIRRAAALPGRLPPGEIGAGEDAGEGEEAGEKYLDNRR